MTTCPFCARDPFHYVDIGVGVMPAAVDCCELGDLYFRGARPAPETVSMPWEEFVEVGSSLSSARSEIARLREALEQIANGREVRMPNGTTEIVDVEDADEIARSALRGSIE